MHTLKLQYLIGLLHVYNYVEKPIRESIKQTLYDIFSVHTIPLIISVGVCISAFIYVWVLAVGYYGRGMYVEGGLLGLTSAGLLWVMVGEWKLWKEICRALRWRDCG